MAQNKFEGKVSGEIWRAHEAAKELVCFRLQNQPHWFRIEYTGQLMLVRANYMSDKLKLAATGGNGIEVGIDDDALTTSAQPPNPNLESFNLVKYIQISA